MTEETIFHKIVSGEAPCHKVWENDNFLAFLSIFPNTEGVTVVVPKEHRPSYFAEVDDAIMADMVSACKEVARVLEAGLDDVGRVGMVFEGFGVDYLHAKLFPMHGTADMDQWEQISSDVDTYFGKYQGYLSTHDADRADDEKLEEIAEKLRANS